LLTLLHRQRDLPLTTCQSLLDVCFGDISVRPFAEVQMLESAVGDEALLYLVKRALNEVIFYFLRNPTTQNKASDGGDMANL